MKKDKTVRFLSTDSPLDETVAGLLKQNTELSREKLFADYIINNSRSMISIISRDYVYRKVNKTFCLNQNLTSEEIIGKTLQDIWGKDNFIGSIKNRIDTCFSGKVIYYQAFFTTPVWGKRYYEVVLRPLPEEAGEVTHVLVETVDVTDVKLKEQAVSAIEWEFQNLESNLPIGFFRCDIKGDILHVNKAFLRILELDSEQAVTGKPLSSMYSEKELCKHHIRAIVDDGLASFSKVSLVSGRGRVLVCRISAFSVHDGSGNMIYIDGAVEDFSRESDLEKRLMQAQRLDTIGLFAGGIAHDFNTILTTIFGYSELSLEGLDNSSEAYSNIKKIIQAVGRARSLTNQILTFSRQVGQARVDVKISDIILETTDSLRPSLPECISITEIMKEPELIVSADPTQLYRVFLNLINNSVQALDNAPGKITVILDKCSGEKLDTLNPGKEHKSEYVMVSISDTGPGMDSSTAERIFEPFFTTGKGGRGTGLGLSVVYGIISEIDGEVSVDSKKGEGTQINIYFPLVDKLRVMENQSHKIKILVVPESDSEAKVISIALANSGYEVKCADPAGNWTSDITDVDAVIIVENKTGTNSGEIIFELENNGLKKPVLCISDFESWLKDENNVPSDTMKSILFKPASLKEIINSLDAMLNKRG